MDWRSGQEPWLGSAMRCETRVRHHARRRAGSRWRDASLMTERVLARLRAGVLLPASALCQHGRGALGAPALRFIDWLADAGFTVWQLLPLVPTDPNGSPYWARSDRA